MVRPAGAEIYVSGKKLRGTVAFGSSVGANRDGRVYV